MDEPSKPMPSSSAPSNSSGVIANPFKNPRTSVNHKRINFTLCCLTNFKISCFVFLTIAPPISGLPPTQFLKTPRFAQSPLSSYQSLRYMRYGYNYKILFKKRSPAQLPLSVLSVISGRIPERLIRPYLCRQTHKMPPRALGRQGPGGLTFKYVFSSPLIFAFHFFNVFPSCMQCLASRHLAGYGNAHNSVLMDFGHRGDYFPRAAGKTHPPTGHSVTLRETIKINCIIPCLVKRGKRGVRKIIGQLCVDFIG